MISENRKKRLSPEITIEFTGMLTVCRGLPHRSLLYSVSVRTVSQRSSLVGNFKYISSMRSCLSCFISWSSGFVCIPHC